MSRTGLIFILLLFSILQAGFCGAKIDTIYFQNGDRVTGEVKALENNQLRLSTDDAGTVKVEWNKVDSVKILNNMRIVLEEGVILYGKILPAGERGKCYIWIREGLPVLMDLIRIVLLSPIEDKFIKRLDGTISSGFSYVKASRIMQMNLNGAIEYEAKKNRIQLSYDGIYTSDPETGKTQRQNAGASFVRIFPRNWFLVSALHAESNSELELDLRASLSLGGGNSIVNTNFTRLSTALGIQATREYSHGDFQNNAEGVVMANYSVFIYDDPEVTFNLSGDLIPSLSDLGRVRTTIDSNLKWEIFNDLYLKWSFYYNFDSRPLSETAEKNDWAITLLGLEYKL